MVGIKYIEGAYWDVLIDEDEFIEANDLPESEEKESKVRFMTPTPEYAKELKERGLT